MSVKNKDYDAVCDESDRLRERVGELKGRVEELERELYDHVIAGRKDVRIITHKQIAETFFVDTDCGRPIDCLLANPLGIFRCEGCGGDGLERPDWPDCKCPHCNGKGYVIRKEKEHGTD